MLEIDQSPIVLGDGFTLSTDTIAESVDRVNSKLRDLRSRSRQMALDVFEVLDLRMTSGFVGEALVAELGEGDTGLERNPSNQGYPDLMNASRPEYRTDIARWKAEDMNAFVRYRHGGIEVKDTFGTKKAGSCLAQGHTRIGKINGKLEWKAHHRYTNSLLALFSDFFDGCPEIVAVMYSGALSEEDWMEKQNPREGSAMTSFTVTKASGWNKLRAGLKLCRDDPRYLSFFGLDRR